MILRPNSLKEMQVQLRKVPKEKRKVIVLVGRHPNEGTTNIASKHHKKWERLGAVVVKIPGHWTPQGLWHKVIKHKLEHDEVQRLTSQVPDDEEVVNSLGTVFNVPVVNFHATGSVEASKIEYSISQNSHITPIDPFSVEIIVREPNHVLVEYIFPKRDKIKTPFIKELAKERVTNRFGMVSGVLDHQYLTTTGPITKVDIEHFGKQHAVQFEEVLKHLAKTGLKKN